MKNEIAILVPCFNESEIVVKFLQLLEETLAELPGCFVVVVIDDCSLDNTRDLLANFAFTARNVSLEVVALRFNVGHQGAIYQGLLYAQAHVFAEHYIIMDSDGEDDPKAIRQLLRHRRADIVHVVRGKRSEGRLFRILYYFYKVLFRVITRRSMNFGNYCMINRRTLEAAVHASFIHFAASLSRMKGRHAYITYDRRKRIGGQSKMNIASLVSHAFKSLTEYADRLLLVFLKLFVVLATVFTGFIFYILYQKLFTEHAIPGWASTMSVGLFNTTLIAIGFYVLGIILLNMNHRRNNLTQRPIYEAIDPESESLPSR